MGICCPATPQVHVYITEILCKSLDLENSNPLKYTQLFYWMKGMFVIVQVDGLWYTVAEIWIHYLDPYLLWCLTSVRDTTSVPEAVCYTSLLWTQFSVFADLRQELRTEYFLDKICKQINKQIKFFCLLKILKIKQATKILLLVFLEMRKWVDCSQNFICKPYKLQTQKKVYLKPVVTTIVQYPIWDTGTNMPRDNSLVWLQA